MVEVSVKLGTSQIQKAIQQLEKLKNNIDENVSIANEKYAKDGKNYLDNRISEIAGSWKGYDGNAPGTTIAVSEGRRAEIHWFGDQISYLEFGTGPNGRRYPYPALFPVAWEYCNYGWQYYNYMDGKGHLTYGVPAYAPMLHTATMLRKSHPSIYRNILSKGR